MGGNFTMIFNSNLTTSTTAAATGAKGNNTPAPRTIATATADTLHKQTFRTLTPG